MHSRPPTNANRRRRNPASPARLIDRARRVPSLRRSIPKSQQNPRLDAALLTLARARLSFPSRIVVAIVILDLARKERTAYTAALNGRARAPQTKRPPNRSLSRPGPY